MFRALRGPFTLFFTQHRFLLPCSYTFSAFPQSPVTIDDNTRASQKRKYALQIFAAYIFKFRIINKILKRKRKKFTSKLSLFLLVFYFILFLRWFYFVSFFQSLTMYGKIRRICVLVTPLFQINVSVSFHLSSVFRFSRLSVRLARPFRARARAIDGRYLFFVTRNCWSVFLEGSTNCEHWPPIVSRTGALRGVFVFLHVREKQRREMLQYLVLTRAHMHKHVEMCW